MQKINGRGGLSDYRVYYEAANAVVHDEPLYGVAFGLSSGLYKYTPFAALPFILICWLPYLYSSTIYYAILYSAIVLFSLWLVFYLHKVRKLPLINKGWTLFFILLFMGKHLERELLLGNVNALLLILTFIVFVWLEQKHQQKAGILLGFVLLVKIHFIILLPYLIVKKQWKAVGFVYLSMIAGLLLPILWKGIEGNTLWLQQWIETIQAHNQILQNNANTVYGIYTNFIGQPLGLLSNPIEIGIILLVVGLTFLMLILFNNRKGENSVQFIEYFILIALIPNLTHTDTQHFLFSWPLISGIIVVLVNEKLRNHTLLIGIMLLAFIPYCLNTSDIIGQNISFQFDKWGLIGLSNIAIIAVSIYMLNNRFLIKKST